MAEPLQIGLLIFPRMTQLDMTGPFEVFARIPDVKVHLIWKRIEPVTSDSGMAILPTVTLDDCPPLDVICIPGGPVQVDLMDDEAIISFVRRQGSQARYVTSVCTGALVLGAAGLLDGYQATTHWGSIDNLAHFGATAVKRAFASIATASPAAASPPAWTSGSISQACSPTGRPPSVSSCSSNTRHSLPSPPDRRTPRPRRCSPRFPRRSRPC